MLSLFVVFVLTVGVIYLADVLTSHEGLLVGVRVAAVVALIFWALNVFGVVDLPIRPW